MMIILTGHPTPNETFRPQAFTPETVKVRKALFDSGDPHLIPLHKALTDEQLNLLRIAFGGDRDGK